MTSTVSRLARPNVWRSVIMFLSIVGPGIITANADNDVGGILTYSQAGAQFGYSLLWLLIPITIALIVVQEMCARMGAVTGKGLGRSHPRELRRQGDILVSAALRSWRRRKYGDRVCRRSLLRADFRRLSARARTPKPSKSRWLLAPRCSSS